MDTTRYIDITGVNLVELVKAAYNLSSPQGMGFFHYRAEPMTDAEAQHIIDFNATSKRIAVDMDYVKGRAVKFTVLKHEDKLYTDKSWYDHHTFQLKELLNLVGFGHKANEVEESTMRY